MFDPLVRTKEVEKLVLIKRKRKYYRFRFGRYYGGIVTADAVGCCFLCAYCWNYFRNLKPDKIGKFYSAKEVAERLISISTEKKCKRIRISGAEPILGKESFNHLVELISILKERFKRFQFILETNGFILGYCPELIEELRKFRDFLLVRISIKGWDEKSFEIVTGAKGKYFKYPLIGLKHLLSCGINAWPAVMYEIFKNDGIRIFKRKIREFGLREEEIEFETIELYPMVRENLKKRGIILDGSL